MEKTTIQTIAREAKVSVGTVDRALNGRGRINYETKRRVLDTAKALGYRPNKIASALGRQRKFRIAVLTPQFPTYFHNEMRNGIIDAQKELADYGTEVDIILSSRLVESEQLALLEKIRDQNYDGIALNASGDALNDSINRFIESGVPVVTFNSDAHNSKRLFFVGEDAYKSGCLAGDMMGRVLGGRGRVICLISFFNPSASANRRNGFIDALKNHYPGIEIANQYEYLDSDELAHKSLESAFCQSERIDGIFGNSATGTVAAALYAETLPAIRRPAVIGYDVTAEVERLLKAGVCTMIIDQDPRKQSYFGVKLLAKHLTEKWMPKCSELEIRVKLVMRYNAEDHTMEQDLKGNILA